MPGLSLVTAPTVEPIAVAEAKEFCRIEVDQHDEDDLVERLIVAARKRCEEWRGRAFITQTWDYFLDEFPVDDWWISQPIILPRAPLISVTSVKYTPDGVSTQTVSASDYYVDTSNIFVPRILPNINKSWPGDLLRVANGVEIRFVVGYGTGAESVPEQTRLALNQLVAYWYENRDAMNEIPQPVDDLLSESPGAWVYA